MSLASCSISELPLEKTYNAVRLVRTLTAV